MTDSDVRRPADPAGDESPGTWVRLAAGGDQAAWNALVERFSPLLWSIARSYRLSTQDAADAVQNTWLHLVEHLGRLKDPDCVGWWLGTTVRNECLVHLRRQNRYGVSTKDVDEIVDLRSDPATDLLIEERNAVLWGALERVSDQCRQILRVLVNDPRPTYQDVAVAMDLPVGSIGPIRGRCLKKLRTCLASIAGG